MSKLSTLRPRAALALFAVMAAGLSATAAMAYSAPRPDGVWESNLGEHLVVGQTCEIEAGGVRSALGSCSWIASGRGGILTIMNVLNYQPAPMSLDVVWMNQSTIYISGSTFHRQG